MKIIKIIGAVIVILTISAIPIFANNFDIGASFQNRYVWRGMDFGNTPVVQPYISYSIVPACVVRYIFRPCNIF